ncbi:MAG: MerR family transcriptional regulator [Chitinophagales bacterium]|nr:MerR family transcriptional regulator [Chitinophagales bacterium]MDW8420175.1 MerR family transcriptional regulator [Chitinophagales bacterium]
MFDTTELAPESEMGRYSIKEVETLSGIKAHTLRIWEQRYNILKPKRTDTNIRYYTDEQLRLILNISTLNRSGYKISRIASMRPEQMREEVLKVEISRDEPDFLMDSLVRSMLDFDELHFEKILQNAILKMGFEQAFIRLIFPFLVRTGVMWQAGSVKVVQEHFISNLIRRKICAAIDSVYVQPGADSKRFVLFLPENETHELLLLFTDYLLRKKNHHVVYLGCSLPMTELPFIATKFKPDYLVTYLTVPLESGTLNNYIKRIAAMLPECKFLIGGSQITLSKVVLPERCIAIQSAEELLQAIEKG